MIHYTLLPEHEMKNLRWEYRTRLFVILLFFVSSAIIVGVFSLLPSYILSRTQEQDALKNLAALEASRQARGIDQIESELAASQATLKEITDDSKIQTPYSDIIQNIAVYHTSLLTINSIDFSTTPDNSTSTVAIIQGKSLTRDALIDFETKLKADPHFTGVELPISDLAQSKNIEYAVRVIALTTPLSQAAINAAASASTTTSLSQ